MANLFPAELDLSALTAQVEQLAQLLSDVAAERSVLALYPFLHLTDNLPLSYALTLRIMLANLRRKVGITSGMANNHLSMPPPSMLEGMVVSPTFGDAGQQPFTMEELGFVWPSERGVFSPSIVPVWLQEQVRILRI